MWLQVGWLFLGSLCFDSCQLTPPKPSVQLCFLYSYVRLVVGVVVCGSMLLAEYFLFQD